MGETRFAGETKGLLDTESGEALAQLYRLHAPWLRRMVALLGRPQGMEPEDVVQETYLRAARYQKEDARLQPKALLLRIARNLVRDKARQSASEARTLQRAVHTGLFDDATPPDQEYLLALKTIILALPPPLRDVFLLSRFTPMTYDEIAKHHGISVKTVEWRMNKALAICADRMRD
ncbi:RNA polymerase sigma factor [Sphingobium boeckii]|uniref:RNA polymerase sigma-70 factor (ECF subfamily) n=1 Tax=Sphingobium boeckii TaxID=1082345 RepID=A0A7W9AG52_9SPHN|nr:RNA polymerase sigma factor [Sphingobium boeckii]MBB5685019.1 RNA polymerase sigma-70 factor (ECF subfamily) [Sphingobium boeckii]